jgi:cytochrome c biogenesis protein CcdA
MFLTRSSVLVTFGAGLLSFLSPCLSYLASAILIFLGISLLFGLFSTAG